MTFTEKLSKLTADRNKSQIARQAGLSATAVTDYLQKGYIPRADNALALARALDVQFEWLVDDRREEWPSPPSTEPSKSSSNMLSDGELMGEILRRRRLAHIDLAEKLERAEKIDWTALNKRLSAIPADGPMPRDLMADALLVYSLFVAYARALGQFDYRVYESVHQAMLPTGGRKPEDLDRERLIARYERMLERSDFSAVLVEASKRPAVKRSQELVEFSAWSTIIKLMTGEMSLHAATNAPRAEPAEPDSGRARRRVIHDD